MYTVEIQKLGYNCIWLKNSRILRCSPYSWPFFLPKKWKWNKNLEFANYGIYEYSLYESGEAAPTRASAEHGSGTHAGWGVVKLNPTPRASALAGTFRHRSPVGASVGRRRCARFEGRRRTEHRSDLIAYCCRCCQRLALNAFIQSDNLVFADILFLNNIFF